MRTLLLAIFPCLAIADNAGLQRDEGYWNEFAHSRVEVRRVGIAREYKKDADGDPINESGSKLRTGEDPAFIEEYRVSFHKHIDEFGNDQKGDTVDGMVSGSECSKKNPTDKLEEQGSWVIIDTGDPELDERLWLLAALAKKERGEVRAFVDVNNKHPHGWCKLVRLHWLD